MALVRVLPHRTIDITTVTPGGSDTYIQFNNAGAFGGSANLKYDGSDLYVGVSLGLHDGSFFRMYDSGDANNIQLTVPTLTGSWVLSWPDGSSGTIAIFDDGSTADGRIAIFSATNKLSGNAGLVYDGSGLQVLGPITGDDDIEITDTTKGLVLTAPDASRWRITVDNTGVLSTTAI